MGDDNRIKGLGAKEGLLALFIIGAAVAIIVPLAVRTQNKNLLLDESSRMRKLFFALDQYEAANDNEPAPSLVALSPAFDPNQAHYVSDLDPFANSKPSPGGYPCDPGLDNSEKSPFRISFSYILNFVRSGKISIEPWAQSKNDGKLGELADEWFGTAQPGPPFQAQVSGRILRINTDGSVFVLQNRGGPKALGDAQDLFIKR